MTNARVSAARSMHPDLSDHQALPAIRQSPFSPFVSSLLITNLPPHVRPGHLTHILSTRKGDGSVDRDDHGVRFIRIYTESRHPKRPLFGALFSSQRRIHPTRTIGSKPTSPLPSQPVSPSTAQHHPSGPRSRVVEVDLDLPALRPVAVAKGDGEDEMTIAELRFATDMDLLKAMIQLKRSTIDGRMIGLEMKHWDRTALRRLWRKII